MSIAKHFSSLVPAVVFLTTTGIVESVSLCSVRAAGRVVDHFPAALGFNCWQLVLAPLPSLYATRGVSSYAFEQNVEHIVVNRLEFRISNVPRTIEDNGSTLVFAGLYRNIENR